jgi:hypothetical protein
MANPNSPVQFGFQGPPGPPGPAPAGTGLCRVNAGVASALANGTTGQVLQIDIGGEAYWGSAPPAPDATGVANGSVRLANALGGTAASPTVVAVNGAAGVATIAATELACSAGTYGQIKSYRGEAQRTNATATTVVTIPLPATGTFAEISVKVIGRRTDAGSDSKIWKLSRSVKNVAGLLGSFVVEGSDLVTGTGTADVVFANTGTDAFVQVQGVAAQTWTFTVSADVVFVL